MSWYLWVLVALVSIAVLAAASYIAVGLVFLKSAFRRKDGIPEAIMPKEGNTPEEKENARIIKDNRKAFNAVTSDWEKQEPPEEIRITSGDGLRLYGRLVKAHEPSHKYFILCHGYMGTGEWMMPYAYVYQKWGWNSLVVDMRAHGESEGKWYGMGWDDRKDVALWMKEIIRRDSEAEIVLQGVSMGGAAVMMALGLEDIPENLRGVIDDCGFTNVWEVFLSSMEKTLGDDRARSILMAGSRVHRALRGWYFQYADSKTELKKADPGLPVLFLQGKDDAFVLEQMTRDAYDAKRGEKDIMIFPDTDHGNSFLRHPEEYFAKVKSFLGRYGM